MEKKICAKCGSEITEDCKNGLCEECANIRRKKILKGVSIAFGIAAGITVGAVYIKKNKDSLIQLTEKFKKVPSLTKNNTVVSNTTADNTPILNSITEESTNYLTEIDQKKIDMALQQHIFSKDMVKRGKGSWEDGYSTVDELLSVWGGKNIIDSFPHWKDYVKGISKEQFEDIIKIACKNVPDIVDAKLFDDTIQITIKSGSKKSSWNAFLCFYDESGKLSTRCVYSSPYPSGNKPKFFADEIRKQMKYVVETQIIPSGES